MSEQTLVEQLHQCARDTKRYGTKYSVGEALPLEAAARIEALEAIVEKLELIVNDAAQLTCQMECCDDDRDGRLCVSCAAQEYMKPIYAERAAQAAKEEVATK